MSTNDKIIQLKQSDRLKESGLVTDSVYYIDTKDVKLSLNHSACSDMIFTVDRKIWQNNHKILEKMAKENGITNQSEILLLKNHINDNHEILVLSSDNNDQVKEQGDPKREFMTFKYSEMGKGDLYESVIFTQDGEPYFIKYDFERQEFTNTEKIEENNRMLRPPELEECPYNPYKFLNLEEVDYYKDFIINNKIDKDYLFQKSLSIISKYNNQDKYKLILVAADVILSIFQDRFSTIHYDYFVGGNGSGKSSLADTFAAVGYRVVIMTDPTAPNIFRLLGVVEPAQCTMILEEAEKIDKSQELMAMLKTGSSRNGRVTRINTNTLKQEFFFSYCLKIIVSERSLSQFIAKGVITRIIPINLFKGSIKHDIKEVLNPTDTGGSENKELLAELEDFKK